MTRPGASEYYIKYETTISVLLKLWELYQTKEDNSENLVGLHQWDK